MEQVPIDYAEIAARPDGVAMLVRLLQARDASEHLLVEQIEKLKRQVAWLTSQLFGRKSEKIDPNQMWLDELLIEAVDKNPPAPPPADQAFEVQSHTRKHTPHGRAEIPEHLPREIEVIDVPESERTLPDGTPRPVIGHEDTERIGYRPGEVFVQVIRRLKYGSPPGAEENGVQIAPMPELLLPRCKADESLLAHLVVSKYVDHLPLNRMESILERSGVLVRRSTMCDWLVETGIAVEPLVACIRQQLLATGLVHHDDTPVDLQDYHAGKPKGRQMREARLWVGSCSPRDGPWTVFDFTLGRGAEGPIRFFKDYRGDIVCDAYSGYGRLLDPAGRVRLCGCWAHARRYFHKAYRGSHPREGAEFIGLIRALYQVEREIREGEPDLADCPPLDDPARVAIDARRLALRTQGSVPVLATIRERIDALMPHTQPSSALGEALTYAHNNWQRLERYASDPRLPIDNNPAEQMIRPVALGRKNWLFFGSERGGKAAANLMSLVATCKRATVEPYAYLCDILKRLPTTMSAKIDSLLPTNWKSH